LNYCWIALHLFQVSMYAYCLMKWKQWQEFSRLSVRTGGSEFFEIC